MAHYASESGEEAEHNPGREVRKTAIHSKGQKQAPGTDSCRVPKRRVRLSDELYLSFILFLLGYVIFKSF